MLVMHTQRVFAAIAVSAPFLVGAWRHHTAWRAAPDACSLLTEAEVSAAIESKSLPGRRVIPNNPAFCIWSDSPTNTLSNRRVTLDILRPGAYDIGKSMSGSGTKIEPVTGIGEDAYYVLGNSSTSPFLYARKKGTDFGVRILNGLKFKAFTLEQEKTKEADLAKAIAAKL